MGFDLPKKYLSYSAYKLWKSSKTGYRKRYYLNEQNFETPQSMFGKHIARKIEEGWFCKGLLYKGIKEKKIEVELVEGLKILGYMDCFDEDSLSIVEYKTGHLSLKDKKPPWSDLKVYKHKQLDFYTLLTNLKYGKYNPKIHLQWLETSFEKETRMFNGKKVEQLGRGKKLKLTGNIETYERLIEDWELEKLKEDIIKVALEITEDYKLWKTKK